MDLYDELVEENEATSKPSQPEDIVEWEDFEEGQESSTEENPEDKVFTLPIVGHTEANNEASSSVDVHKNEEAPVGTGLPDLLFNLNPSSLAICQVDDSAYPYLIKATWCEHTAATRI